MMRMASPLHKILEKAMDLDAKDRATLAGLLIESLESDAETGAEEAWLIEVERRMEEIDSGTVRTLPWNELRTRLDRDLNALEKR